MPVWSILPNTRKLTTALIGLNIISHGKLTEVLEKLEGLANITWAAVVTGRYDILAEVVFKGEMEELYRITSIDIPRIGNVVKSENVRRDEVKQQVGQSTQRHCRRRNRRTYENCCIGRTRDAGSGRGG